MSHLLHSEASSAGPHYRLRVAVRCGAGPFILLLAAGIAAGQEASRQSTTSDAAVAARAGQVEGRPYTIKEGDFRLLITPEIGLEYNGNINTSSFDPQQDFILRPAVGFIASYPIGKRNLLSLNANIGYQQYFEHPEYSRFSLTSGSQVSFDLYAGDYWINLHDRFAYTQDSSQQAAVANTASYGGFDNTAGLSVSRDFRDLVPTLGYDHHTYIASAQQYQYMDSGAEMVNGQLGFTLHPTVTAGLEANGSFTTYDQHYLNNNTGCSGGAYADWKPGHYLRIQARGGYSAYLFDQTSYVIKAVDQNAWYLGLTVTHDITEAISYSLSAGHELRLGIQSDTIEDWYARANVNWKLVKNLTLNTGLSYESGMQGAGSATRSVQENYNWLSGNLGLSHPITKRLTASLDYRFTIRSSNLPSRDYTQNVVGLRVTYSLQ